MDAAMAQPKKKKPGPKPAPERVRSAAIIIRGRPEWKAWVEDLAEHDRSPSINDLIDRALVTYAREIRYPKPAPKR